MSVIRHKMSGLWKRRARPDVPAAGGNTAGYGNTPYGAAPYGD